MILLNESEFKATYLIRFHEKIEQILTSIPTTRAKMRHTKIELKKFCQTLKQPKLLVAFKRVFKKWCEMLKNYRRKVLTQIVPSECSCPESDTKCKHRILLGSKVTENALPRRARSVTVNKVRDGMK